MKNLVIIILVALLEVAAIFAIIRVWRHKHRHWMSKLFWSIVLLVPVFGLLFYGFLTVTPEAQEDHTEDRIGADGGAHF